MPVTPDDITELKHAYQVLGVPTTAPPFEIKQAYRRMARRWHPDLFKNGTPDHAQATLMMKIINDAYAKVQNAPLRGYVERRGDREEARPPKRWTVIVDSEGFPMGDRGDFWIRFFMGACFGVLVSLRIVLDFYDSLVWLVLAVPATMAFCGYGFARYGDRFWQHVFSRSRWWW